MGQSCDCCTSDIPRKEHAATRPPKQKDLLDGDAHDILYTTPDTTDVEVDEMTVSSTFAVELLQYHSNASKYEEFVTAVENDNNQLVMQLIEEYASLDLLDSEFDNGNNALHIAVQNKSYNLILYLLSNGISVNEQNNYGDTPLHIAVQLNNLRIVTLLISEKCNADPKIRNVNNETPLTIANQMKYFDIVCLLSPKTQKLLREKSGGKNAKDPYLNMKRVKTKVALQQISDMTNEKNSLPKLEAFLLKKQGKMPYKWQRRWCIVRDSYILWSEKQRDISDTKNAKERKKFNNSLNLMAITAVKAVIKGQTQRKFVIEVGGKGSKDKQQTYLWKCATKNDRDLWVKGINEHIKHLKSIISYLAKDE